MAGVYKGLRCGVGGPKVSHFLNEDDVVFIGEWEKENVVNLRRILQCFYLVAGLRINLSKSWLYGIRVEEPERIQMAGHLRYQTGSLPFKYLGLQVGGNMNLIDAWDPIVELFRIRLSLWKAKKL
ncbi:uncharacterized protein LOC143564108 [Bidens hawaiensis]|uniref:uncharacterized protein LOC143564108 n=1 Tax=Bidens hawaiensis TaxID=980011 RepID=UPI00404B4C1B